AAGMLLITHEDLVAGFEFQSVGDVAVALGGIARERDLISGGADKLRQRFAMLNIWIVAPNRILFGIGLRHFLGVEEGIKHSLKHRQRTRSDRPIVEIDLIARDHKLIAHRRPVGVLILVVKRRRRQGPGISTPLGKGVGLESSEGAEARERGEKMAAIKHEGPPDEKHATLARWSGERKIHRGDAESCR